MGVQKNCDSNVHTIEGNKKTEEINYDEFISSAGELGKYQIYICFCTFPFYFFGVFCYYSQQFMTEVASQHWCWIPELANLTETERRELAIPKDEHDTLYGYSRCFAYEANWTQVLATGEHPDETWKTVPCQHGWEFNKTEFPYATISSELGWVCDKDSYQATAQSLFFVGSIIGGILLGWVADRFGRIPAAVFSNVIGACAGTASVFTKNFIQFAICRLIMGMAYDNCMMMAYLIVLEYTSPKYRTMLTNLSYAVFLTVAAVALPWIALACDDWKTIGLVTSLTMMASVLAFVLIPESPRWLLSKGRVDDAVNKILKIAKVNNKEVPLDKIEKFKQTVARNKEKQASIMDLIKNSLLRRIFICICIEYMCCMIVFDALVRTIGQLQFDFFLSFSVTSLTELPAVVIISFALDYTGRKLMLITVMVVSGIFSFMVPFVGMGIPSVACAVVARFAVNMACNTTFQWAAELMPTSVRGSGTSFVHICGSVGTVISPFVAYLETYMVGLPMLVIGSVAVFAAIVGFFLPETARKEMPQTFEDAEDLAKNQGWMEIPFLQRKKLVINL